MEQSFVTVMNDIGIETLRILICGLGSIGSRHLRIIRESFPGIKVGILHSGCNSSRENSGSDSVFWSLEDAIAWKPHGAIICTPATDHVEKALNFARCGIGLLIEKPLGTGLEPIKDLRELRTLSNRVPILVGYVLRHDPCVDVIKERLEVGSIGEVIEADFYCGSWLPDWRIGIDYRKSVSARSDQGGGVLLELSHEIDLARYILGEFDLDYYSARSSGILDIDVEDSVTLVGRSEKSLSTSLRLNFCSRPAKRQVVIRGTNGEMKWDLNSGIVWGADHKGFTSKIHKDNISADDRFYFQIKNFIECLKGYGKPVCTIYDGLRVLEIVSLARKYSEETLKLRNA